jgi:hypothetical protein
MSFWSTLKNIYRLRRRQETLHIALHVWGTSGDPRISLTLPRELAEIMQIHVHYQLQDEIWRSFVLQRDTGTESAAHYNWFPLSSCLRNQSPATDGSPAVKRHAFSGYRVEANTFGGSPSWVFTPAPDQGPSSP